MSGFSSMPLWALNMAAAMNIGPDWRPKGPIMSRPVPAPVPVGNVRFASDLMPTARRTGPGRKTLYTHHKKIGRSCYRPHQGSQERLRRWKQMEKQRGDAS